MDLSTLYADDSSTEIQKCRTENQRLHKFIMSDWVHCNKCYTRPGSKNEMKFFLTSCGHIFCQECVQKCTKENCFVCAVKCNTITLSQQMKPDVDIYFKDPSEQIKKLIQVINFQKSHRGRLLSWLFKDKMQSYPHVPPKIIDKLEKLERENMVLHHENNYMKKLLSGRIKIAAQGGSPSTISRSSPMQQASTSRADIQRTPSTEQLQANHFSPFNSASRSKLSQTYCSPLTEKCSFNSSRVIVRTPPIKGQIGIVKSNTNEQTLTSSAKPTLNRENSGQFRSGYATPNLVPSRVPSSLSAGARLNFPVTPRRIEGFRSNSPSSKSTR
ncbi:Uncharacterised protein g2083 [Pycnogonum litorale]